MKYTKKILSHLDKNKKVKPDLIYTRKQVWEYLGESRQTFYTRLKKHNWTDVNRYALQELLENGVVILMSGSDLTEEIETFLEKQKKKRRALYWSRKEMANHLGISLSLLYKRFDKHNWKEQEILKIEKL